MSRRTSKPGVEPVWQLAKKPHPRLKDVRRAKVHGRAAQGLGSAGRSGGTKSAGGHGGHVERGMRGPERGIRARGRSTRVR